MFYPYWILKLSHIHIGSHRSLNCHRKEPTLFRLSSSAPGFRRARQSTLDSSAWRASCRRSARCASCSARMSRAARRALWTSGTSGLTNLRIAAVFGALNGSSTVVSEQSVVRNKRWFMVAMVPHLNDFGVCAIYSEPLGQWPFLWSSGGSTTEGDRRKKTPNVNPKG